MQFDCIETTDKNLHSPCPFDTAIQLPALRSIRTTPIMLEIWDHPFDDGVILTSGLTRVKLLRLLIPIPFSLI